MARDYSKSYKENFPDNSMIGIGKRGQMVIFVIVALIIVALILLFIFLRPSFVEVFETAFSPTSYLTGCIEPEIRPAVKILADNGGYQNPEGVVSYRGKQIKYLCYSGDNYETCIIQQPMTKQNFEKELNLMIKPKANQCMKNLIAEYEKRGYTVSSGGINSGVSLVPGKIIVSFNAPLTVSKSTTQTFQNFDIELKSEMYDLLFIASSIIDYESKLGGSATELYLQYYPNLKIQKTKLSDGTTIYKLSDVITEEEFNFASRSLVFPPGYGLEEI